MVEASEHVGDAAALGIAAVDSLGMVLVDRAAVDGDHAGVQEPVAGRIVIPEVIEDAAPRAEASEDGPGTTGRVVVATRGVAVGQFAAADGDRASKVIRDAGTTPAQPGPPRWRCRCCCRRPGHCYG